MQGLHPRFGGDMPLKLGDVQAVLGMKEAPGDDKELHSADFKAPFLCLLFPSSNQTRTSLIVSWSRWQLHHLLGPISTVSTVY